MTRKRALGAVCSLVASLTLGVSAAWAANPLGIAWATTQNVELYAKPTGMLIAGRCNPYDPKFAEARKKGAEVLMYINPSERPDNRVCDLDQKFYMGNYGAVPLWPYPSYGQRIKYPKMHLTDMRPGSKWMNWVVSYIEKLMRENRVDGVFLDVVGPKLWAPLAEWKTWPTWEQNLWTDGQVELVRRLDAKRRAINPKFIIVNNAPWHRGGTDTYGLIGEKYVDGIALEHPKVDSTWHQKYVTRQFGNLGQRRVLIIANSAEEARIWSRRAGVTHVTGQTTAQYRYPLAPPVSFSYLGDRE